MEEEKSHPEMKATLVADMSEKERNMFIDTMEDGMMKETLVKHRADGLYKRYRKEDKTDYCKQTRDKKEKEEIETLQARNQMLEDQARRQQDAFIDYQQKTEDRFNKLAQLISSLK